jgi:hypothetical protein
LILWKIILAVVSDYFKRNSITWEIGERCLIHLAIFTAGIRKTHTTIDDPRQLVGRRDLKAEYEGFLYHEGLREKI